MLMTQTQWNGEDDTFHFCPADHGDVLVYLSLHIFALKMRMEQKLSLKSAVSSPFWHFPPVLATSHSFSISVNRSQCIRITGQRFAIGYVYTERNPFSKRNRVRSVSVNGALSLASWRLLTKRISSNKRRRVWDTFRAPLLLLLLRAGQ